MRLAYDRSALPSHSNAITKETVMKAAIMAAAAILLAGVIGTSNAGAQQSGFKRTVLQQGDLSMAGHESVTAVAEFQPGATVGRHTHPGKRSETFTKARLFSSRTASPR
jgi:hypothetical protein